MHLRIRHEIQCRFDVPARNLVSVLRLSPRSHEGQHVTDWWIDADIDCGLRAGDDEYGNLTHTFSTGGPIGGIKITAAGTVDTFDTAGVTRSTAERLPIPIFLRETALTAADEPLRAFAESCVAGQDSVLGKLHAIMDGVSGTIALETGTQSTSAIDTLASRSGSQGAHAHLFIAAARHAGIPSRFVNGYLVRGRSGEATCHSWAEAHVSGLGWVGFDPLNNVCPRGEHVRGAVGLDSLGASFVRGHHPNQTTHLLKITVSS